MFSNVQEESAMNDLEKAIKDDLGITAEEEKKNRLDAIKSQGATENAITLKKLQRNLESTGALHYCAERINQYVEQSITSLRLLKESVYKAHMVQMADSLKLK